jgi:hypothetical protein
VRSPLKQQVPDFMCHHVRQNLGNGCANAHGRFPSVVSNK